ncbi:MAG: peptide chain release factor N(5)-glutamine methyltransferase [Bacillota bacterium]
MTPLKALSQAGQTLEQAQIPNAQNEARFILLDILQTDMAGLLRDGMKEMGQKELALFWKRIEERASGKPLAYILGKECFMGLWFLVHEHVLIPRQDTETLVREALACLSKHSKCRVLDMCCGSGAVGISIAHLKREASVWAADVSPVCIDVAKKNAQQNKVYGRMHFVVSDLFEKLQGERFHAIVSNPPYIRDDEMETISHEVRDFEPALALRGGEDGMDYYRKIVPAARQHLRKGGVLVLETASDQAAVVAEMMLRAGFGAICVVRDDGGRPRVVSGRYEGK